jgi:divinyl protochlorophyllide a 8-vinyl-reductase
MSRLGGQPVAVVASDRSLREKTGRIGPNAIIRVAEALREQVGEGVAAKVFRSAGLDAYLTALPVHMVDEREVTILHQVMRSELGFERARWVSRAAGLHTGDYLLANRIPRMAQMVLRTLPSGLAGRMLLAAIRRNAWTFAGSGTFTARAGRPFRIWIEGCPTCRGSKSHEPLCDYYAATFERLFRSLVDPDVSVREIECQATGAEACMFEVRW